jgi:hypothetical protein
MRFPKLSAKWIAVSLLIIGAFILHQIPKSMEVTLRVQADHIGFKLPGRETEIALLENLPLTALHVSHVASLSLPVKTVYEQGQALVSSPQRMTLRSHEGQALRLAWRGEALRLMQLSLASGSQVILSVDQQSQLIMQVDSPGMSQLQLGVLGAFTLSGYDLMVVDEQGNELRSTAVQPERLLEVTPARHNVEMAWQPAVFALTLDVSGARGVETDWPLPFGPRLALHHLHFTRKEGTALVSSIQSLSVQPLMKKDESQSKVYLDLRTEDEFRLDSMTFSGTALTCVLIGRTHELRYGPGASRPNHMPSLLQYWVQDGFVQVVKDIVGIAK